MKLKLQYVISMRMFLKKCSETINIYWNNIFILFKKSLNLALYRVKHLNHKHTDTYVVKYQNIEHCSVNYLLRIIFCQVCKCTSCCPWVHSTEDFISPKRVISGLTLRTREKGATGKSQDDNTLLLLLLLNNN